MIPELLKNHLNFNLTNASLELFLVIATSKYKKIAYFSNEELDIELLKKNISRINSSVKVIEFPDFDCDFLSNLSPTSEIKTSRIRTLYDLIFKDEQDVILICCIKTLLTKTIKINKNNNSLFRLTINKDIKYEDIINFLESSGYERLDFVHNPGEYSVRGEILDIFSPIEDHPIRIIFDFDKIYKINLFSVDNQLSKKKINEYNLFLSSEIQFNKENIECFREKFRKLIIKDKDDYYKSISEKNILTGSEQFFPILNREYNSLLEYLSKFKLVFDLDFEFYFSNYYKQKIDILGDFKNYFEEESDYFLKVDDLKKNIEDNYLLIDQKQLTKEKNEFVEFSSNIELKKHDKQTNKELLFNLIKQKEILLLCFFSQGGKKKYCNYLKYHNIQFVEISLFNFDNILKHSSKVFVLEYEIKNSFYLIYNNLVKLCFISEEDIFEKSLKKSVKKNIKEENLIEEYSTLKIGDYIVHNDHGVGKYNGLKVKDLNNVLLEFIEIIYFGGDKLLIPVENLELISRYGHSDISVNLDKLGLQNWQQRKSIVKKRIKDIAKILIKTAAERKLKKGDILVPQTYEYEKFSSEFEFTETSDQLKSINQIENDLSSGQPMDRLLCGDVGFGKTEIAMRAAFITISAGYQVALLCPKLLLVNQHERNFKKRFINFKYIIERISRKESDNQKKLIKERIKNGKIDIIIGTHAIFSSDIIFNKLGLIIIDEEQSFGVEQKEKLKKIKPNCHVLTLSATPIPRTLQSSIFQLKNISLIKTPPLSRLNIKTYLMRFEKKQIKQIIEKEIERNGQIFYVAPRISDLEKIKKNLVSIIPNLVFDIIHGKLSTKEIESSYERFFKRKSNLLISTAMIESGLDVSNVNTIIIEKPNLFGLSQLYQLRGRVGRSSRQAYAYLIVDDFRKIKEDSLRKLQIISKIKSLGSGLSIASNDLDLRGGGNIVGEEQSGHIKEVGIELYYKMLKETVDEIKSTKPLEDDWSPLIRLGFPVSIPEEYIKDIDVRLSLYRKISNIDNINDLNDMLTNLSDRFGKVPISFKNLFHILEIKIMAKKANINKIDYSNKGFVLEFKTDKMKKIEDIIKLVEKNPKLLKLLPNSKLFYYNEKVEDIQRVNGLKNLLSIILK
ncbi:MAG: transcription-repair coupling factor [Rickettsiales bacterium]|nr:transcription-repair coupling factor [Rickettsiales bacterium]